MPGARRRCPGRRDSARGCSGLPHVLCSGWRPGDSPPAPRADGGTTMERRRWPSVGVPDLVFGLVLIAVLIGGRTGFLNDPGTSWHLRLGREIARAGAVPRFDTLTYTREHVP